MKIVATGKYVFLDIVKESDAVAGVGGVVLAEFQSEREKREREGKTLKRPYGRIFSIGPDAKVKRADGQDAKVGDIVVYGICQKIEPQTRAPFVVVVDENIKGVIEFEASDEPVAAPAAPASPGIAVVRRPLAVAGLAGQVAGTK